MPSNFAGRIADSAARFADRPAIERITARGVESTPYGALLDRARRTAGWLTAQGFQRGDRAALLADNSADWIAAYLGTLWVGGVAVPLDTAYKPTQVKTVLASSGARLIWTSTRYVETARAGAAEVGAVTIALVDADMVDLIGPTAVGAAAPLAEPTAVEPTAAAVMLYTSGTTADPKGVVLTHANLDAERAAALAVIDASERDAILGVLPLFHALAQMANLLIPLTVGARVVFLETVSSSTLLEALTARQISIFACVPQFFYLIHQRVTAEVAKGGAARVRIFRTLLAVNRICRDRVGWNPGRRWFARVHTRLGPAMRVLITGGSRFDEAIGRDLYALGFTILNAYGLTETSGGATVQRPGDRFTTSVGQPFPGVDVKIGPAEMTDGEGLDGEILIRGPIVMKEYYGRPEATREAIDPDGWFHSGDLGRMDEAGRVYITGRKKEIIVLSSGKNLYPEEIETHYRQSPLIAELCVLGLSRPGEPAAERLHAVIVPNAETLRARGIVNVGDALRFEIETLSATLPAHKRILSYDLSTDPLPRTTTGKLKRHDIEKLALALADAKAQGGASAAPLTDEDQRWLAEDRHAPLIATIAERTERPSIRPAENLELDLGLDSMERVELLTMLERQAGTAVAPDVRATIFTVRQLVEAVLAGAPARAADPAAEPAWATLLTETDPALDAHFRGSRHATGLLISLLARGLLLCARLVLRVDVRGTEEVPRSGACLLCPNHQTFFDGFLLAAVLPVTMIERLFFVGAAELFQTPATRAFARFINLVPIDPDMHLVDAMRAGAAGLRHGKMLLIFPEGERTIDGELKRFRKGAAILAGELHVPIVPIALTGLFPIWPRGRSIQWGTLWPPRARTITATFGPALTVPRGDAAAGTDQVHQAVADLVAKAGPA